MNTTPLFLGACLGAVALLSACKPAIDSNTLAQNDKASASLTETYWKLTQIDGSDVKMSADQEREKHFILNTIDKQITGFSGCNRFFGQYAVAEHSPDSLKFENLGSTKMACPDNDFNEQDFLTVLANTAHYEIDGEALVLLGKQRAKLAKFNSVHMQLEE